MKRGRYTAIEGMGEYLGKLFFCIDDLYYRYDMAAGQVEAGYPQPLSAWHFPAEFRSGLDAALNGRGPYAGKAYFFKGGQYLRYDWQRDAVDEGFPASLDAWNLPAEYRTGIDAALNGFGEYEGKCYLFRGDSYLRYDWSTDRVDEGYPSPISAWKLPQGFGPSIDAAVNAPANYQPAPADGAAAPDAYRGKAWFFARGRYLRYDWAADRVDEGFPAPMSAWTLTNPGDGWTLGTLSSRFETGGRGIGTVSSGAGDAGGVSYGSYQMTSQPSGGTVARFIGAAEFPWRDRFAGLVPGTPDFTAQWKALAAEAPEAFFDAQHAFVQRTHYLPLMQRIASDDHLDVSSRSRALQDVVWSTAVQHGPGTPVIHRAMQQLGQPLDLSDAKLDRSLITAVYAERGKRGSDGNLVYFRNNSKAVQDGVARRFQDEERDALRMFDSGP